MNSQDILKRENSSSRAGVAIKLARGSGSISTVIIVCDSSKRYGFGGDRGGGGDGRKSLYIPEVIAVSW